LYLSHSTELKIHYAYTAYTRSFFNRGGGAGEGVGRNKRNITKWKKTKERSSEERKIATISFAFLAQAIHESAPSEFHLFLNPSYLSTLLAIAYIKQTWRTRINGKSRLSFDERGGASEAGHILRIISYRSVDLGATY
jgi:hypothetical protein